MSNSSTIPFLFSSLLLLLLNLRPGSAFGMVNTVQIVASSDYSIMSAIPTSFIPPQVMDGITTSWLPVTTAYPYLAGCSSAFFLYPGKPLPNAFDPGYGYFAGGDLSCLPPAMTTWREQIYQNPDGYTSLSIQPIVCPESWTTAATEIRYTSSTIVMCCPS